MNTITQTRGSAAILVVAIAMAALASSAVGAAAAAPTVNGTVGPGFTITLTMHGKKVTKLKAGARTASSSATARSIHDFHLSGPGLNRVLTAVKLQRNEELQLDAEKGELSLPVRPPRFDHARRLPRRLSHERNAGGSPRSKGRPPAPPSPKTPSHLERRYGNEAPHPLQDTPRRLGRRADRSARRSRFSTGAGIASPSSRSRRCSTAN